MTQIDCSFVEYVTTLHRPQFRENTIDLAAVAADGPPPLLLRPQVSSEEQEGLEEAEGGRLWRNGGGGGGNRAGSRRLVHVYCMPRTHTINLYIATDLAQFVKK